MVLSVCCLALALGILGTVLEMLIGGVTKILDTRKGQLPSLNELASTSARQKNPLPYNPAAARPQRPLARAPAPAPAPVVLVQARKQPAQHRPSLLLAHQRLAGPGPEQPTWSQRYAHRDLGHWAVAKTSDGRLITRDNWQILTLYLQIKHCSVLLC